MLLNMRYSACKPSCRSLLTCSCIGVCAEVRSAWAKHKAAVLLFPRVCCTQPILLSIPIRLTPSCWEGWPGSALGPEEALSAGALEPGVGLLGEGVPSGAGVAGEMVRILAAFL